jgi:hypothetical protein
MPTNLQKAQQRYAQLVNAPVAPSPLLADERQRVLRHLDDGVVCPCCGRLAKRYHRKLYSTQVACLLVMARLSGGSTTKYVHKEDLMKAQPELAGAFGTGDFAKLQYWKMIEEKPKDDDADKRTSGYWKITQIGLDFAMNRSKAHGYAVVYDGVFERLTGDMVTVHDCLGKKFSYAELWKT